MMRTDGEGAVGRLNRMSTASVGRFLIFAAIVVLAMGCDDGSTAAAPSPSPARPIPVAAPYRGPGAPLGDQLTVPMGTVLVGSTLHRGPQLYFDGEFVKERGWVAYLAVPGDPRLVIAELQTQLRAAGFDLRPAATEGTGWSTTADAFCALAGTSYDCSAFGPAVPADEHRSYDVEFHRWAAAGGRPPVSIMSVTFEDSDHPLIDGRSYGRSDAVLGPEPPSVPSHWPSIAAVGDEFGSGYAESLRALRVEPGSRLLTTTMGGHGCGEPGYSAVLSIDRPVDTTLRAYLHQAESIVGGGSIGQVERSTFSDGATLYSAIVVDMAGPSFTLELTEPRRGVALLHISACVVRD